MSSTAPTRAIVGMALTLTLLVAACGDDDATTTTTAAESDETSTSTSSTTASATTETTSATTDTTASTTTAPPDDAPVASGSGCAPGAGPLPDGRWYGEVVVAYIDQLEFDLACWYTGDDATVAAAEDGEESPPPNDYYVRNDNPTTRDVPVAAVVDVRWYPEAGNPDSEEVVAYDDWRADREARAAQLAVWLEVEDGAITSIEEQWVP